MRLNTPTASPTQTTHEGAPSVFNSKETGFRRAVLSCFLWEDSFYLEDEPVEKRIYRLAQKVEPQYAGVVAVAAREEMYLRHVPLLLLSAISKRASELVRLDPTFDPSFVSDLIARVIQRPDELAEFLAIHAKMQGRNPSDLKPILSNQMKKGLARAFRKFDEYQLAKYDRAGPIKLRDVLFLCHARPETPEQEALWQRLIDGTMETPDTWETNLSSGADKKETFERLLNEERLGYLALLRNLRNMVKAGVSDSLISSAIRARRGAKYVLPFRYVAAARAVPRFEPALDAAMCASLENLPQLDGRTYVLVDVSASMNWHVAAKSALTLMDAAATLASMVTGDVRLFTFSNDVVEVPPRRGMAGVEAVINSQYHSGTRLGAAVDDLRETIEADGYEGTTRLIVLTDEQSSDAVTLGPPANHNYMINVHGYQHSVARDGTWTKIHGFSENILRYVSEFEKELSQP